MTKNLVSYDRLALFSGLSMGGYQIGCGIIIRKTEKSQPDTKFCYPVTTQHEESVSDSRT
jgi:hypothetical protein